MIEVLFWLLVGLIVLAVVCALSFGAGWVAHRSNSVQQLLKQATGQVDSQVDHYVELQKIISDLVDGKK